MLRYLLLFSAFSLFLSVQSCKSYEPAGAVAVSKSGGPVQNLYFSSTENDYLYKTQIEIYGNNLSGILIIKKISDETHRVVMTTDFGNKMLDFEISDTDFKVNYLVQDLDRKVVKKFLERDFRVLLKEKHAVSHTFEDSEHQIFSSENPEQRNYLYYSKTDGLLKKIVFTENGKERLNFLFDGKSAIFADSITLIHKDFRLKIQLKRMDTEID